MHWLRTHLTLNRAFVILLAAAIILGAIASYIVFYGGGTYVVSSPLPTSTVAFNASTTATSTLASSTASSTPANASTTASTTLANYSATYATPPVSWTEGYDTLSITGATLSGSQLTLDVNVQMGAIAECVPLNIKLVTDEMGDTEGPLNAAFTFGENGTCIGAPGASYPGQQVTFNVDPTSMPLSFTTGGSSNKFFELSTTASGGIMISLPPTQG